MFDADGNGHDPVGAPFTDHPTNPGPFAVTVTGVPDGKKAVQMTCAVVQVPPDGLLVTKSAGLTESTSTESATPLLITFVDTGPELPPPVTLAPVLVSVPSAVGTIVILRLTVCPALSEAIVHVIEFVPVQPVESAVAFKLPGRVSVTAMPVRVVPPGFVT